MIVHFLFSFPFSFFFIPFCEVGGFEAILPPIFFFYSVCEFSRFEATMREKGKDGGKVKKNKRNSGLDQFLYISFFLWSDCDDA